RAAVLEEGDDRVLEVAAAVRPGGGRREQRQLVHGKKGHGDFEVLFRPVPECQASDRAKPMKLLRVSGRWGGGRGGRRLDRPPVPALLVGAGDVGAVSLRVLGEQVR